MCNRIVFGDELPDQSPSMARVRLNAWLTPPSNPCPLHVASRWVPCCPDLLLGVLEIVQVTQRGLNLQAGFVCCRQPQVSSGKLAMLDLARALPPWYRQRALADLDRLIAHLEGSTPSPRQTRKRRAAAAKRAGRSGAPEDHLVLLRRSRQVLLAAQSSAVRVSEPDAKVA